MGVLLTFQVKGFLGSKNDIYLLKMQSYLLLERFLRKLTNETEEERFYSLQKNL